MLMTRASVVDALVGFSIYEFFILSVWILDVLNEGRSLFLSLWLFWFFLEFASCFTFLFHDCFPFNF